MRIGIAILFALFCGVLPAQEPQLFGPPKSGARFTSPSFAETFGPTAPAPKVTPAPKSCAIPLLATAVKDDVNYAIQRIAPKESLDPGMQVVKGLPVCGAPEDSPTAGGQKTPAAGK